MGAIQTISDIDTVIDPINDIAAIRINQNDKDIIKNYLRRIIGNTS